MRQTITVLCGIIVVALTLNAFHEVENSNQDLHLKEIKFQNVQADLEKLDQDYRLLEQDSTKTKEEKDAEIQKLQQREKDLEQQLEAKRLIKEQEAKAYAAVESRFGGDCASWMAEAGITDVLNATTLIGRESGCRVNATNPSSGAYGIPQALPASKIAYCNNDPVCQLKWMQTYVMDRYGSWADAVDWHYAHSWY